MHRPKELLLNHDQTSKEFVYKVICVNCVIREGQCKPFYDGDLDECYHKCWHYSKAVRAIRKVLDKFDV